MLLPYIPATEEHGCAAGHGEHRDGGRVGVQETHIRVGRVSAANPSPELTSDGAAKDDVRRPLLGAWHMGQHASATERMPFLRDARERILACTSSHPNKRTLDDAALS
jgi:hypothetical protein